MKATGTKTRKSLLLQCITLIGNESGSIENQLFENWSFIYNIVEGRSVITHRK